MKVLADMDKAETAKPYLKPFVLFYKDYLIGEDPTNVERVMMKIRRMGSFKPWGSAVRTHWPARIQGGGGILR